MELARLTDSFNLFIGLRSGLCDLISLTGKGRLIVLYPEHIGNDNINLPVEQGVTDIYELGRKNDIWCYEYIKKHEDELIDTILSKLN